jgi:hypothetical protein
MEPRLGGDPFYRLAVVFMTGDGGLAVDEGLMHAASRYRERPAAPDAAEARLCSSEEADTDYALRRRSVRAPASSPVPNSTREAGSGTAATSRS